MRNYSFANKSLNRLFFLSLSFIGHQTGRFAADHLPEPDKGDIELCGWLDAGM
jgi:hypothetical protein